MLARNLTKVRNLCLVFVRAELTESYLNWVLVIMLIAALTHVSMSGFRPASLGTKASRTRRKECQETSRCCCSSEVGCTTAQVVGERRGLRATAEQSQSDERRGRELEVKSRVARHSGAMNAARRTVFCNRR